jgi:hypothetical protein
VTKGPIYFSIDFKPNVTLSSAFHDRTNGHQANDESLSLLDGDVHFFPNIRPT